MTSTLNLYVPLFIFNWVYFIVLHLLASYLLQSYLTLFPRWSISTVLRVQTSPDHVRPFPCSVSGWSCPTCQILTQTLHSQVNDDTPDSLTQSDIKIIKICSQLCRQVHQQFFILACTAYISSSDQWSVSEVSGPRSLVTVSPLNLTNTFNNLCSFSVIMSGVSCRIIIPAWWTWFGLEI